MSAHSLSVWLFNDHVGQLVFERGQLGFTYDPAWLSSDKACPLSHSLPLQVEPFDDHQCRPFFAGLLPEGEMRKALAQQLQVTQTNDFMMLDRIGGECAGAVTFLHSNERPGQDEQPPAVHWLNDSELQELVCDIRSRPMLADTVGVRLSLAGAQDKIPVVVDGDRIGVPMYGMPSTHILKPAIKQVDDSVINECFCLHLAASMGLPTAQAHIGHAGGESFLLVKRYDRVGVGSEVVRLHQEDFCQALGVSTDLKYQNEGGPSFADCFDLVRASIPRSAIHLISLMRYAFFTTLVGNHDAHGKNYSLLYSPDGPGLAPLYDVLCTAIYPELTDKMAMKVGGKYSFTELHGRHWEKFAVECGLGPGGTRKAIGDMAKVMTEKAEELASRSPYQGNTTIDLIVGLIRKRTRLTQERLAEFARKGQ